MTTKPRSAAAPLTGEQIEDLQQIAADHLFMHGSQTNDWKGDLKIFIKGEGCWVTDAHGNRLLDGMGGLWYKAVGYGRKEIADAMYAQVLAIESPPAPGACVPTVQLSGKVAELYPDHGCRVFFVSGGSEAVETAVKMAKKYQQIKGKGGAYKIISRRGSYQGATAMAVSLGKASYADSMGPDMPGAMWVTNWNSYRPPFEGNLKDVAIKCANEFETTILHQGPDTVAAIIAEPISTATGIQVPPPEYFQRLREIATKYDIILIADEVITGFGRMGTYFGPENWDVQPDITTVAKALTSGYAPLGAVIATKRVADAFIGGDRETFRHLITFGGHPVAAAAGLANLKIFEREDLVGNSRRMGTYLFEQLQGLKKHKIVGDVRGGLGLLAAVELVQDRATKKQFPKDAGLAKKLPKMLYDRKLVSFRAADVIALCPPLSINKGEVDFIVSVLDDAIGKLQKELGVA
jgi:adenosylmethionine-8-amino-7-oxononanoate aminotransferase